MPKDQRTSPEAALRSLARALAPYIVEELRQLESLERETLSPEFDAATCARFVADLGDGVLQRSQALFEVLDRDGIIDSVALAGTLGIRPRELSGYLTTPLKRRAAALKLPLPFSGGLGGEPYGGIRSPSTNMDPQRTHWQDRDGIAARMLRAIQTDLIDRRRRETEALVFDGKPMHTPNHALTPAETKATATAGDGEIWVFANTFQGYPIFGGHDGLYEVANEAIRRWEKDRLVPGSLTLLRAVLFAKARAQRMTDYDAPAWAEHKWHMRVLTRRIAARVNSGDVDDEYETAVVWIRSTPADRRELWEQVTEEEARTQQPTQTGATFDVVPSTLAENQDIVQLMQEKNERGEGDG